MISDAKRYINPKMENELKIFKKKILYRYANKEISDDFVFPRVSTANHHDTRSSQQQTFTATSHRSGAED